MKEYWVIERGNFLVHKDMNPTCMEEFEACAFEFGIDFKEESVYDNEEDAKAAFNRKESCILNNENDYWAGEMYVLSHGDDDEGIVAPWDCDMFANLE